MAVRKSGVSRRQVLAGAGLAAAGALAMPAIARAAETLRVGVYGGFFKDAFDKHIFPVFTKESGIAIEPVAEPTGPAWVVQLDQAARAGVAPADVSMISQVSMLRGETSNLWAKLDMAALPHAKDVFPHLINKYEDGKVAGVGAVSWFITLVSNTKTFPQAPTSWAEFWKPEHRNQLGLLALVNNSFLLDITAATFFGGTKHLDTKQGQLDCFKKLSEVKPNVKLWYRDEAQFEQALKSGEIPMGQYYHDVTQQAAAHGFPVRSTFPKEGGVNDSGSWAVSRASKKMKEALIFIDYMCRPETQTLLSQKIHTSPTIPRKLTSLTDAEFAAVSSDIPPIVPHYAMYQKESDFLNEKWTEMIVG